MRIKILLILGLIGVIFVSSTVSTLSSYNTVSSFGVSISPDREKIQQKTSIKQQ